MGRQAYPEGGVAPPQIDGQPEKGVMWFGRGKSQSVALKPPNVLDGEGCLLSPTSQGLHHHRDESYSIDIIAL